MFPSLSRGGKKKSNLVELLEGKKTDTVPQDINSF